MPRSGYIDCFAAVPYYPDKFATTPARKESNDAVFALKKNEFLKVPLVSAAEHFAVLLKRRLDEPASQTFAAQLWAQAVLVPIPSSTPTKEAPDPLKFPQYRLARELVRAKVGAEALPILRRVKAVPKAVDCALAGPRTPLGCRSRRVALVRGARCSRSPRRACTRRRRRHPRDPDIRGGARAPERRTSRSDPRAHRRVHVSRRGPRAQTRAPPVGRDIRLPGSGVAPDSAMRKSGAARAGRRSCIIESQIDSKAWTSSRGPPSPAPPRT